MLGLLIALCSLCASSSAFAFEPKALHSHVNDYARILSSAAERRLDARLREFQQTHGPQFVVLTVDTLGGVPLQEYAFQTASAWKLGNAHRDDGLLLLIASREHKLRIEVGYGLEGLIPDAIAARILDELLRPSLRVGENDFGVEKTIDALIVAAGGEHDPSLDSRASSARSSETGRDLGASHVSAPTVEDKAVGYLVGGIFGLLSILGVVHSIRRRLTGVHSTQPQLSESVGSSSSDSSSGTSTSSGASGDGGSFGGGGASGSW